LKTYKELGVVDRFDPGNRKGVLLTRNGKMEFRVTKSHGLSMGDELIPQDELRVIGRNGSDKFNNNLRKGLKILRVKVESAKTQAHQRTVLPAIRHDESPTGLIPGFERGSRHKRW